MRLLKGTLHNFGSFADAEIDLSEVSVGVVMGHNGAGKSTAVVDSVTWCLFGECRVATDAMVRLGADEMSVEWAFDLNNQLYRVLRKRSLKTERGNSELSVSLWDGAAWTPVAVGMKPAQKKLFELLNSDYQLLTTTGFLLQGQADQFSRSTAGERKAILAQILRLDQYGPLKQAAMKHLTIADAKHEEKASQLTALDAEAATAESLEAHHAEVTSTLAESQKAIEQLEQLQQDVTAKKAALTAELEQLAAIPEQLTALQTRQTSLGDSHRAMTTRRERAAKILGNREMIEAKVKEEESVRQSQSMLAEDRAFLVAEVVSAQSRATSILGDLAAMPAQQSRLEEQQSAVRGQMAGLQERRERAAKILEQRATIEAKVKDEAACREQAQAIDDDLKQLRNESAGMAQAVKDLQPKILGGLDLQRRVSEAKAEVDRQVQQARTERDTLQRAYDRDVEACRMLEQVPCGPDLQGRCQFTLSAVQLKNGLAARSQALAAQLTDPEAIAPTATAVLRDVIGQHLDWEQAGYPAQAGVIEGQIQANEAKQREFELKRDALIEQRHSLATFTALLPELAAAEREIAQVDQDLTQRGQELAQIEQDLQAVHARAAERARVKEGVGAELTTLQLKLTDCQALLQIRQQTLDELATFTALLPELASSEREVVTVDEDLARIDDDLGRIHQERERLYSKLADRDRLTTEQDRLSVEWQQDSLLLTRLRTDGQTALGRLKELELELKSAQEAGRQAASLRQECEALCIEGRHFEALATAYTQIPVLILESSIPLLEEEANRILSKISTAGLRVTLDTQKALKSRDGLAETLDIKVRDVFGERLLENYSGGERARVDLAVRIGLSKLLANRAGARLETLVVDEAFAAVDREGVEQLIECLPMLSQEFPLVLFVTHDEVFKGSIAQQIIVSKGANGSTVEIVA